MSFENIYYKGKKMKRDTSTQVKTIHVARNRLQRWWFLKVNPKVSPNDVVLKKDLKGVFDFKVDLTKSMKKIHDA